MEQNLPIVTKKLWNMVRLALYMLRKGMSKKKLLLDLNLMLMRTKLAGKTLFTTASKATVAGSTNLTDIGGGREYEFSSSNTPLYRHYFTNNKRKKHHKSYYTPSAIDDINTIEAVNNMWETMILSSDDVSVVASPVVSGFGYGRSPVVRQLRITDSPYPLQNDNCSVGGDKYVDEAADEFIKRFYSQLKQQM